MTAIKPNDESEVPITEFEVGDGGTLRMANYAEAETRADFYQWVACFWSRSPKDLADAMEECRPLAWAVHSIYLDVRDELKAELQGAGSGHEGELATLKAQVEALPEEPEEGATDWLLGLTSKEFEGRVVPEIEKWFGEAPSWNFESDYLQSGTAQGVDLEFFRAMAPDDLETLGFEVIEGE